MFFMIYYMVVYLIRSDWPIQCGWHVKDLNVQYTRNIDILKDNKRIYQIYDTNIFNLIYYAMQCNADHVLKPRIVKFILLSGQSYGSWIVVAFTGCNTIMSRHGMPIQF